MGNNDTRRRAHPALVPPARANTAAATTAGNGRPNERGSSPGQADVTLDSIGDAVLSTDLAGRVMYLNATAEVLTGWSRADAVDRPLDEVFHIINRGTRDRARDPMSLAVALNRPVGLTAHCILVRRNGTETEIEDSASPIHDRNQHVTGAVIVLRDVGAALEMAREMSHLAQYDVLTRLPNRLLLRDRLTEAIALAHRRCRPLAVMFLDIDGFKGLNDSLGHAAGDALLQAVAVRLTAALRQSDTVCRYGDDEFVIVLPEIEHTEHAAAVGAKLLQAVAGPHPVGSREARISGSLGVSLYPDHGRDAATLIMNADAAMYDAKRAGSGTLRLATRSRPDLARLGTGGDDAAYYPRL